MPTVIPMNSPISKRRCPCFLAVIVAGLLWGPLWGGWAGAAGVTEIGKAVDIPGTWTRQNQLYVKGDLGVNAENLAGLADWLAKEAPNWSVVLVQSAADERFESGDAEIHYGMDAVEHALGRVLSNRTDFGALVDERTGEANGAIFALFLEEKKFSYFGSEAMDKRGLGEKNWLGGLDQSAISAMRSGGRIIDAVKNTITKIEGDLSRKILGEKVGRERIVKETNQALESARASVVALREKVGALVSELDDPPGDLVRPAFDQMETQLSRAESLLLLEDFGGARMAAAGVDKSAREHLEKLQAHAKDAERLDELAARLEEARPGPNDAGRKELEAAKESLAAAVRGYREARPGYGGHIESAWVWVNAADTAAEVERERIADEKTRQEQLDGLAKGAAGAGAAGLLLGGFGLNRRRRRSKMEAIERLEVWEKALREKTDGLFGLLDRTAVVVGSAAELDERGYTGETLRLSRQTIRDVDELFIMSSCAERVLEDARRLIHPPNLVTRTGNLVRKGLYDKALRLLEDEPVRFSPDDQLEPIVRGRKSRRDSLLGERESYEPFELSFQELIDAFNERAKRALDALDLIENSWAGMTGEVDAVQERIEQLAELEEAVTGAAADDSLFALPGLFEKLLPSAQGDLDAAVRMGAGDPVQALRDPAARARRKAGDGVRLGRGILAIRESKVPRLRTAVQHLGAGGYLTEWIDVSLGVLSEKGDKVALAAVEGPASEAIAGFEGDVQSLVDRVEVTRGLSVRLKDSSLPRIEDARARLEEGRHRLSSRLGIPEKEAFAEPGRVPGEWLGKAVDQADAAKAALDRGDTGAAKEALESVKEFTGKADALVAATLELSRDADSLIKERRKAAKDIAELIPDYEGILRRLVREFVPAALDPGVGGEETGTSIETHIDSAGKALEASRRCVEDAVDGFSGGKILKAGDLLSRAQGEVEAARALLGEITQQDRRLEDRCESNTGQLGSLQLRMEGIEERVRDARAMERTLHLHDEAGSALTLAASLVEGQRRQGNPFQAGEELAAAARVLQLVEDRIENDWKLHEEAFRSSKAAYTQLQALAKLVERSQSDRIPDSPEIVEAVRLIPDLHRQYDEIRHALVREHGDWNAANDMADQLTADTARQIAILEKELEEAQAAVAALRRGSAEVRNALDWTGGYGVRISGSPGADQLEHGRVALSEGDYLATQALSMKAARTAANAVISATNLVARRRREAQRRAAEERRRREASRRRSSFSTSSLSSSRGGSMFGGGGIGGGSRGSFSSSSGGSRSSFSTGSGFSRSGW